MQRGPPSLELANTRTGKLSNRGNTETGWEQGPNNQEGGDISGGGEGAGGKNKEEQTEGGGTEEVVSKAVVSQPAQRAHRPARGWAARTPAFSFSPALPWPDPYLTLVRPLRGVHLLDVSVQVIGPGEKREPRQTLK